MSEVVQVTVAEEQKSERIDKVRCRNKRVNGHVHKCSNGLKMHVVTVNGKSVKGNYKVKGNDEIYSNNSRARRVRYSTGRYEFRSLL